MNKWKALHKSLEVMQYPSALPKPNDPALDEFEESFGFKLPKSYRSFIKVFGPGELAWDYQIAAPGYPGQLYTVDLGLLNKQIKESMTKRALRRMQDPERVARLVYFCRVQGGDLIGWDPEDVQDARRHEYGIYSYGRADVTKKLADDFEGFVEKVCLGEENLNIPGRDPSLPTRRGFDPACDLSEHIAKLAGGKKTKSGPT